MLEILYVSELCSDNVFNNILNSSTIKPSQSGQKYHKLLSEGLSNQDEVCMIDIISKIPINSKSHKKTIWNLENEVIGKMRFNYIPFINKPIIRSIILLIYSFTKTLFWNRNKNPKVIICDVLSFSNSIGVLIAAKIRGIKCIGIVTDLPYYQEKTNTRSKIIKDIIYYFINKYNAYLLMTEKMNLIVNKKNRPYCIVEGLVDIRMEDINPIIQKTFPRNIMYAGALLEIFGVKLLIEAFMSLNDDDIILSLYGDGPMVVDINKYIKKDKRIKYLGVVDNEEVVKAQLSATLLVNTRLTSVNFSEYSFPSKNIEYMVSGTPVVTTALPGIPNEYFDYLYVFDDETVNGIASTLKHLLSLPYNELQIKGINARNFVLKDKNNSSQAHKVVNFIHHNLE